MNTWFINGRTANASTLGIDAVLLAVTLAGIAMTASATVPEGVSPGAVDRIVEVESRCPSFYWSGAPGAAAYELVVYRLPEEGQTPDTGEIEFSLSDEVLYAKVPGGATAWQPSLADGLEPSGSYVWFVRAVLREGAGETVEAGDWSAARFFSVPAAPSGEQVRQALEVLQRWQAANGDDTLTPSSGATTAAASVSGAGTDAGAGARTGPGSTRPKSVPTATAAIKGSVPDTTGEVYGVVGISNSPDGAGMAAANAAGGPDLVLDGSLDGFADAHLTEQGIDRPSPGARTFFLTNSVGGTLNLSVAGEVSAVSLAGDGAGLIGVDAEALDGLDGADYATDAEAAGLVAAHAASADHDGRYFTETELSTSGTAGAVHWDNLGGVPAGFADGVDDDTQYTVGPGIIIDGGEIRIDPAAFSTQLSTLDSVGSVGWFTSIAIGADGLGLISYYDQTNEYLKTAHCNDTACSSATTYESCQTDWSSHTSIAIGTDGFGLISYYDALDTNLNVAHCLDTACYDPEISVVDTEGSVGQHTSIAIGADGLGLISYFDETNNDLKVAHCVDPVCFHATTTTLDSIGIVGLYTSIAIGSDGLGLISYLDDSNGDLKVAHCADVVCSSSTTTTLDDTGDVGAYTSLVIGADGFGLISYFDISNGNLKVAHCTDITCSSATNATLDTVGEVGEHTSIAIGTDGLGLISYYDVSNGNLKIAHCADASCSSATTATLDSTGWVGQYTSIAIGADGLGLISYYDTTNGDLKVAHLGIGVP
jgi:preprotein translocase subunit Sec61beta